MLKVDAEGSDVGIVHAVVAYAKAMDEYFGLGGHGLWPMQLRFETQHGEANATEAAAITELLALLASHRYRCKQDGGDMECILQAGAAAGVAA